MLSHKVATLIAGIMSVTVQICGVDSAGLDLYEGCECKMKSGDPGVCTLLPKCESIDTALKARKFPLRDLVICSFVDDTEVICCPNEPKPSFPTQVDESVLPTDDEPTHESQRGSDIERYECKMKSGDPGVCTLLFKCESIYTALKVGKFLLKDLVTCPSVDDTDTICCPEEPKPTFPTAIDQYVFPTDDGRDYESQRESDIVGSVCNLKSGKRGICTILEECESMFPAVVLDESLKSDAVMCPDFGDKEVICCPEKQSQNAKLRAQRKADIEGYDCNMRSGEGGVCAILQQCKSIDAGTFPRSDLVICSHGNDTDVICCPFSTEEEDESEVSENEKPDTGSQSGPYAAKWITNLAPKDRGKLIKSVILHPDYKTSRKYHDIALIRLNTTVPLTSRNIFPACLDTSTTDIESNRELIAAGWGRTDTTTNHKSDVLLKATLTTVRLPTCNIQFKRHNRQYINLPDGLLGGQMCAHDPNQQKDTYQGDSGGPLQINVHEQVAKVIGVTQFGLDCGPPLPSVYTRVSFYLDWLEEEVWPDQV